MTMTKIEVYKRNSKLTFASCYNKKQAKFCEI